MRPFKVSSGTNTREVMCREAIENLIRFSIGIEDIDDLIDDLESTFKNIKI